MIEKKRPIPMLLSTKNPPKLKRSDFLGTVLPFLFWIGAIYSRGLVIQPHCASQPEQCTPSSLLSMDRLAVGLEVMDADRLSFSTQGLSGILALSVPPLWEGALLLLGRISPMTALFAIGTDFVIFAQTTAWNGLFTETAHLLTQRPRPFVYTDPLRAKDFSNYTSFYSGHTSFSATATVYLTLTLAARQAPLALVGIAGIGSFALTFSTGLYRVLAGRHFPTDVLFGALMGALVAIGVALRHKKTSP
ncbi:phosphatase PAP2 family protein [Bdellovibrionota bacterium FG-1]